MPTDPKDTHSINIAVGMKSRSAAQERAYDHPGHMHEYIFNQTLANFHWEMLELYQDACRDPATYSPLLFLAPRNHGKTTLFAETVPLHRIGHDQQELCQVISSVDSLAKKRVKKVANCIRFNPRYIELFGNLYPGTDSDYQWSPSGEAIEVKRDKQLVWASEGGDQRDPTFLALGILSSVEGGRATYQGYDDVVNQKNSRSEATRIQVREKYWMSFQPMLFPSGIEVFVGTRYGYDDLYSELIPVFDGERLYTDLYAVKDDGQLVEID